MPQCFDIKLNTYVYCSSNFGTYVAVGIILPLAILIITIIISVYLRYKRRRLRREQQQISMTTVVAINNDGEQQQAPYNYSFPPNYTSIVDASDDKPPTYEQTVQHLTELNNTTENTAAASAAVLPVTTITSSSGVQPPQFLRKQT